MTKKSAFPYLEINSRASSIQQRTVYSKQHNGISERLYIASKLVAGLDRKMWVAYMQDCPSEKSRIEYLVEEQYKIADELIKHDKL